jgi:hypothetical protein
MTTFQPQQSDRERYARQKADGSMVQIHVTNSSTKLRAHIHEARKIQCNNVSSSVRSQIIDSHFLQIEALPLVKTRFLRLANSSPMAARSPARRQRDGGAISGKIAGRLSRVMSAQLPGNGRTLAAVMPPNVRQDGSQDNLPCAGLGRAMSALETCETTRNLAAQQPHNFPAMAGQWQRQCRRTSVKTTRNLVAQQPCRSPHDGQRDISQAARRILVVSFYP